MIHLLAVLTGAALMFSAALHIAGSDLDRGVGTAQVRFIIAGLLLTASPEAVNVLGSAVTAWLEVPAPAGPVAAAVLVAACVAAVLPHDPADYKALVQVPATEGAKL